MKELFLKIKKDDISFIALLLLIFLYVIVVFADFFAIYPSNYSNRKLAYQPPNNIYIIDKDNKLVRPYTYNFIKTFDNDTFSIKYKQDRSKKYPIKILNFTC